jgi:hypothetical protein
VTNEIERWPLRPHKPVVFAGDLPEPADPIQPTGEVYYPVTNGRVYLKPDGLIVSLNGRGRTVTVDKDEVRSVGLALLAHAEREGWV